MEINWERQKDEKFKWKWVPQITISPITQNGGMLIT